MMEQVVLTVLTFLGLKINEGIKHRYEVNAQQVESMEKHCPPVMELKPDLPAALLDDYREQCQPLIQSWKKKAAPP